MHTAPYSSFPPRHHSRPIHRPAKAGPQPPQAITSVTLILPSWGDGWGTNNDQPPPLHCQPAHPTRAHLSTPIKKPIFGWQDVSDAAYYKLSKVDPDGGMNTQVDEDVSQGVESITRIVPLYASADTQYMLESCDRAHACTPTANNQTITQAQLNRAIGYIKASNTGDRDWFGKSLSLSADGTTLAVGAIGEDSNAIGIGGDQSNNSASGAGAVYLY